MWREAILGDGLTFRPLDAGVLVITEEEAFSAVALVAAHHVDTTLLTAAIALSTLIHICARQVIGGAVVCRPGSRVCPQTSAQRAEGNLKNSSPSLI